MRSVRIWMTEPDDRSISLVLTATSAHSMSGLKKRGEEMLCVMERCVLWCQCTIDLPLPNLLHCNID